ncbi:MAG: hypothetical protein M3297_08450 [Thermoproteota archaeon]|nr:hypothetical protein [Thermoproteota archaeon]
MVGQIVANFDLYVWIALGLFIVGVIAALIYDNSTATIKTKPRKQQPLHKPSTQSEQARS